MILLKAGNDIESRGCPCFDISWMCGCNVRLISWLSNSASIAVEIWICRRGNKPQFCITSFQVDLLRSFLLTQNMIALPVFTPLMWTVDTGLISPWHMHTLVPYKWLIPRGGRRFVKILSYGFFTCFWVSHIVRIFFNHQREGS